MMIREDMEAIDTERHFEEGDEEMGWTHNENKVWLPGKNFVKKLKDQGYQVVSNEKVKAEGG